MLSTKRANMISKILSLLLVAALSFFFVSSWITDTAFVKDSLESIEENNQTVMVLSAATLSASLALSAMPDDFGSSLANTLSQMNTFFVIILAILLLEKVLLLYGIKLAFGLLIPWACIAGAISVAIGRNALKSFALRLGVLGLAIALVVPCSTHVTNYVAEDLTAYVEATIAETEDGAGKLNAAMESDGEDKNMFEKLSELFQTAISGIADLLQHFQNIIRRCMNSIAILIFKNLIMPLLTFFVLKWVLKETFSISLPELPKKLTKRDETKTKDETVLDAELVGIGEGDA